MEKILLFIKHKLPFIWQFFDRGNGLIFQLFFGKKLEKIIEKILPSNELNQYTFRSVLPSDLEALSNMLQAQSPAQVQYFRPHGFSVKNLKKQLDNPAFLMMAAFDTNGQIVAYFFLRFFVNGKVFLGRIVDQNHQRKGIGSAMNGILYHIAKAMSFRLFTTISQHNTAIQSLHARHSQMVVHKNLGNGYQLVEILL